MRLVCAVAVMCGCGSSSSTVDALGPPGPCSVQLSGAITTSHACGAPRATWTSSDDQSSFALSITTGSPALQLTIGFAGEPALRRHYADTDADASGSLMLTSDSSMVWTSAAPVAGTLITSQPSIPSSKIFCRQPPQGQIRPGRLDATHTRAIVLPP